MRKAVGVGGTPIFANNLPARLRDALAGGNIECIARGKHHSSVSRSSRPYLAVAGGQDAKVDEDVDVLDSSLGALIVGVGTSMTLSSKPAKGGKEEMTCALERVSRA